MKIAYKCAVEGFSGADHKAFEGFFRMTAALGISFELVLESSAADIVILNSDSPGVVARFLEMSPRPKGVFIGAAHPDPQWPQLARPIRLTKVLQTLQQIAADAAPLSVEESHQEAASREAVTVRSTPESPSRNSVASSQEVNRNSMANVDPLGGAETAILVIDDSDLALKFMRSRLEGFGCVVDLVRSGEEAMVRVLERTYSMVFIDVMMQGMDGYQTCRMIKQRKYHSGKPPVAVMLTSRGGTVDKIRGSLAGCDAYLTKPINEAELLKVLSRCGISPRHVATQPRL